MIPQKDQEMCQQVPVRPARSYPSHKEVKGTRASLYQITVLGVRSFSGKSPSGANLEMQLRVLYFDPPAASHQGRAVWVWDEHADAAVKEKDQIWGGGNRDRVLGSEWVISFSGDKGLRTDLLEYYKIRMFFHGFLCRGLWTFPFVLCRIVTGWSRDGRSRGGQQRGCPGHQRLLQFLLESKICISSQGQQPKSRAAVF